MKRQRGRSRNKGNNNSGNRSYDSSGPDVKVRGNATQVYDKYIALARDAASSGNRVKAENLRQHAEHYLRLANAQEAAKQAAREEAEARRQQSRDQSSDHDSDDQKERKSKRQSRKKQDKQAEQANGSDGLKVVTPEGSENADAAPKPVRRRRAPAKTKPEAEAPTAAE